MNTAPSRLFQQWKFTLHSFYLHKLYILIWDFIIDHPRNCSFKLWVTLKLNLHQNQFKFSGDNSFERRERESVRERECEWDCECV
jgi:hypothetical protein